MKKIAILFFILIAIIAGVSYTYMKYRANYYEAKRENNQFESYFEQEFYGNEVATIVNLAIDNNERYKIPKDSTGKYIEDDSYSVRSDIYITDSEKVYSMELLNLGEISNFVNNYSNVKFKCTKVEYHKKTKRLSYLYIEQIS